MSESKIVLAIPPFRNAMAPVLGISLLKSCLARAGYDCEVIYLNLIFRNVLGEALYDLIATGFGGGLGEILFAERLFYKNSDLFKEAALALFEKREDEQCALFADLLHQLFPRTSSAAVIMRLADQASSFVDHAADLLLAKKPWMVGIGSSMAENNAAISILAEVKKLNPNILTIMGGANCDSPMAAELFHSFPHLDYIASGEADATFPRLVDHLKNGKTDVYIPGILSRHAYGLAQRANLSADEFENLPFPDYEDYFIQSASYHIDPKWTMIPIEISRGCPWSRPESKCKFCGLNSDSNTIAFRGKSDQRATAELRFLAKRYPSPFVRLNDNLFERRRFKVFLPAFKECKRKYFCEITGAQSEESIRMLADAGVTMLQPGIENLDNRNLRLMRKPTNAQQNIRLLRNAAQYDLQVSWHILSGIPGEEDSDDYYDELTDLVSSISHLAPPDEARVIYLARYSEYLEHAEQYGLTPILEMPWVRFAYAGLTEETRRHITYFFDSKFLQGRKRSEGFRRLKELVNRWQNEHRHAYLIAVSHKKTLHIIDSRKSRSTFWHRLHGLRREIYEFCIKDRSEEQILDAFAKQIDQDRIRKILHDLSSRRLIHKIGDRYLSLATYLLRDKGMLRPKNLILESLVSLPWEELRHYAEYANASRLELIGTFVKLKLLKIILQSHEVLLFILTMPLRFLRILLCIGRS